MATVPHQEIVALAQCRGQIEALDAPARAAPFRSVATDNYCRAIKLAQDTGSDNTDDSDVPQQAALDDHEIRFRIESRPNSSDHFLDDRVLDLLALAAEECARYDGAQLDGQVATVRGDARLLRRLLRNLLENGRRHGTPPIRVRITHSGGKAVITVWDDGPGVPPTEFENVFRPFYRPKDAGDRAGSGLGLSLVRQIARRHGGDAGCAAMDDGRSCFVVTLPA